MAESTQQSNNLVTAHATTVRLAPRKMRLVTNLVKRMHVQDAITQLAFTPKKGSEILIKLLKSAVANAEHNFSMKADDLFVKEITCDMGPVMRRYFPRARGSAFVIRKKTCHVHVTLELRPGKGGSHKRLKGVEGAVRSQPSTTAGLPEATTTKTVKRSRVRGESKTVKTSEQEKLQQEQLKRRPDNA